MNPWIRLLAFGLVVGSTACHQSTASELKTIAGLDAAGAKVGLALVPVRNAPAAVLPVSSDPGVRQSVAMVKTHLFAAVECPDDEIDALTADGQADELLVDAERRLAGHPLCRVLGSRLMSWDVLVAAYRRASAWPEAMPADPAQKAALERQYVVTQSLHLALRTNGLKAALAQGREQRGKSGGDGVEAMMTALDPAFEPCAPAGSSASALTKELRTKYYSCADATHFNAGGDGASYAQLRDGLTAGIAELHAEVYRHMAIDNPLLERLWDVTTAVEPYDAAQADERDVALYLAGRSVPGFDFAAVYGQKSLLSVQPAPAAARSATAPSRYRAPSLALLDTASLPVLIQQLLAALNTGSAGTPVPGGGVIGKPLAGGGSGGGGSKPSSGGGGGGGMSGGAGGGAGGGGAGGGNACSCGPGSSMPSGSGKAATGSQTPPSSITTNNTTNNTTINQDNSTTTQNQDNSTNNSNNTSNSNNDNSVNDSNNDSSVNDSNNDSSVNDSNNDNSASADDGALGEDSGGGDWGGGDADSGGGDWGGGE